jgi:hypothetical protein
MMIEAVCEETILQKKKRKFQIRHARPMATGQPPNKAVAPPAGHATAAAKEARPYCPIETDDDAPEEAKCLFSALASYRGLWPDWFKKHAPKHIREDSRESRMFEAMHTFEQSFLIWGHAVGFRLMHGHLRLLFEWHKHINDNKPKPQAGCCSTPAPATPYGRHYRGFFPHTRWGARLLFHVRPRLGGACVEGRGTPDEVSSALYETGPG